MNESLRIAVLHMDIRHGDLIGNRAMLLSMAEQAARNGAQLILAPELAISGYAFDGRHDVASHVEEVTGDTITALAALARRYGVYCGFGFAERDPATEIFYNSAALIDPHGQLAAHHRKIATERRWASPGSLTPCSSVETPWGRIGLLICADAYYGILPRIQALYDVDLLLTPANWPPSGLDPRELWRARALENGMGLVACNRTGIDRRMDCRACASFVVTDSGMVLLDAASPTSMIQYANYPLCEGRFATAARRAIVAHRRPERYGAISLDMNSLDHFAVLWGLREGEALEVCCVVPEGEPSAASYMEEVITRQTEGRPRLVVLPANATPVSPGQLGDLAAKAIAVAGPLVRPEGDGHSLGICTGTAYHWLPAEDDAVIVDVGSARVALVHDEALRHPECAIALSKQGCDLAVTVLDSVSDDDRLLLGVKCLERMAVAMVGADGASICLPPSGHARWGETVQRGPGICAQRVETATTRAKRFQDRVDLGVLLRR